MNRVFTFYPWGSKGDYGNLSYILRPGRKRTIKADPYETHFWGNCVVWILFSHCVVGFKQLTKTIENSDTLYMYQCHYVDTLNLLVFYLWNQWENINSIYNLWYGFWQQ